MASTAVRIVSISAAQNKRGKDCFEGGMETGNFTWFKDMGGNSNWMYMTVSNVADEVVELALWLLYEASTEPMVDPLTSSGAIQVGFFNQSKNLNRQVPLFELAEESKQGLELPPGQQATLKVRINDLSSHHQNQRFIIVVGPCDAPIRGSRSVPIEIMSKPRAPEAAPGAPNGGASQSPEPSFDRVIKVDPAEQAPRGGKRPAPPASSESSQMPPPKRPCDQGASLLSQLADVTDPAPTPTRQVDVILTLLEGLSQEAQADLYARLGTSLQRRRGVDSIGEARGDGAELAPKPRRLRPLVKALMAFRQGAKKAQLERSAFVGVADRVPTWVTDVLDKLPSEEQLALSEEQLEAFFDDSSGRSILDILSPRFHSTADGGDSPDRSPDRD